MSVRRFPLIAVLLAMVAAALLLGCEVEFVGDAARENLASFVIDVVSTSVNESINP
ncbi:MAG: hypothetical protein WBE26_08025 [Phycisphaerae bacterium]